MRPALEIRARHPSVSVLVLSQYVEHGARDEVTRRLGRRGRVPAQGSDRRRHRLRGRRASRRGRRGSAITILVSTLLSRRRSAGPLPSTTPREREVLELMAEGRSNQGIADALVISLRAVEKYVSSIFGSSASPPRGATALRARRSALPAFLKASAQTKERTYSHPPTPTVPRGHPADARRRAVVAPARRRQRRRRGCAPRRQVGFLHTVFLFFIPLMALAAYLLLSGYRAARRP